MEESLTLWVNQHTHSIKSLSPGQWSPNLPINLKINLVSIWINAIKYSLNSSHKLFCKVKWQLYLNDNFKSFSPSWLKAPEIRYFNILLFALTTQVLTICRGHKYSGFRIIFQVFPKQIPFLEYLLQDYYKKKNSKGCIILLNREKNVSSKSFHMKKP